MNFLELDGFGESTGGERSHVSQRLSVVAGLLKLGIASQMKSTLIPPHKRPVIPPITAIPAYF
jgi:hypothetical protein